MSATDEQLTDRIWLGTFPSADEAFAARVTALVHELEPESPRTLQSAPRESSARIVVRSNVALARAGDEIVWYVYRDGSPAPGSKLRSLRLQSARPRLCGRRRGVHSGRDECPRRLPFDAPAQAEARFAGARRPEAPRLTWRH